MNFLIIFDSTNINYSPNDNINYPQMCRMFELLCIHSICKLSIFSYFSIIQILIKK